MSFDPNAIRANRNYFAKKLQAEKQRINVLRAIEGGNFDFVLLDTLGREPFNQGHIPGACCAPASEMEVIFPQLPKDKEIVTYRWGHD